MDPRQKALPLAFTATLIFAACSSQSATLPSSTLPRNSANSTSEIRTGVYSNDPSKLWLAGPESVVKPGESSKLSLTKPEICPIIDPVKIVKQLNIDGVVTSLDWTQAGYGSTCEARIAIGASEGFLSWGVGKADPKYWEVVGTDESGTTTAEVVGGQPARLYVGAEKQYASVVVAVKDLWFTVSVRDVEITDNASVLRFAEDLVAALKTVTPIATPALDSIASAPLRLSGAQVCSLMSDDVLKTLVKLRTYPEIPTDILPDSYQLSDKSVWCTRGHGRTRVTISNTKPYDWANTQPEESGYTTPASFGEIVGFRRRELDEAGAFLKTIATVPWRTSWVEIEIQYLSEGPELDAILGKEVQEVLSKLDKRVNDTSVL